MPEKKPAEPEPHREKPDEQPPSVAAASPDEYDRRGVKLPARTLVGGIITPI